MATHEIRSEARLELGPDDDGRALSAVEFADAEFQEPWRYERVNGSLVVMAPDGRDHVGATSPWLRRLFRYWDNHPEIVDLITPNAWIRVDDGTDRIGDIGVYLAGDPGPRTIPDQVPDLMFEVVSPGRASRDRDYLVKRGEYERLGVKEYVVVDRFTRRVTVFSLEPDGYVERTLTEGDTYTSPLLPGFEVVLAEVFSS
jgi:Uma2 family endonuclease